MGVLLFMEEKDSIIPVRLRQSTEEWLQPPTFICSPGNTVSLSCYIPTTVPINCYHGSMDYWMWAKSILQRRGNHCTVPICWICRKNQSRIISPSQKHFLSG